MADYLTTLLGRDANRQQQQMTLEARYSPYLKYSEPALVTHKQSLFQTGVFCKGSHVSF